MIILSSKKDFITAAFLWKLIFHISNLMRSGEAPFESNLITGITWIIVYFCSKLALILSQGSWPLSSLATPLLHPSHPPSLLILVSHPLLNVDRNNCDTCQSRWRINILCCPICGGHILHALVYRGHAALGTFLYPGQDALCTFLDQGLSALGTTRYFRAGSPTYNTVL